MLMNRHSLPLVLRAMIALLALFINLWLQWLPPPAGAHFADEWLRDRMITARASELPEQRFVVVDIDEGSLAELGPWPWPRERLAQLLETLIAHHGASTIALDLFLPERLDAAGDERLAMLARFGPLVVAQAFDYDGSRPLRLGFLSGGEVRDRGALDNPGNDSASKPGNGSASKPGNDSVSKPGNDSASKPVNDSVSNQGKDSASRPDNHRASSSASLAATDTLPAVQASGYIANHEGLRLASHTGNIGFVPDKDGMIRRLPWLTHFNGRDYPTLSLALFECCQGTTRHRGAKPVPGGFWRIPYTRQWSAYTVIPAADILQGRIAPELVRGKRVLLGSSSLGLADRVATPLSPNTSGLLVHAAALSSLLDQDAGHAPKPWPGRWLATGYSLLVAWLVWFSFPRLSALANVSLLGLGSLAWLALAYWLTPHDDLLSTTGPLVANLFLLAVAVPFDWQMSQSKSRRLLGTLRQYVAQAVVDELLRRDLQDPLAPVRCEVTTLIADMQGYTAQVESLTVEQASQLTRDFLACLTAPVIARGGTLDKYTGDGLVAFWGAPLPVADHADLALEAAAEMLQAVRSFSQHREAQGFAPLRVRIGIQSGIAMAGDFGTNFRSIYTAVGDCVNVASRLESMARDFPHDVIIGDGTAALCRRHKLKLLGEFVLRGKEHPTVLYTLQD